MSTSILPGHSIDCSSTRRSFLFNVVIIRTLDGDAAELRLGTILRGPIVCTADIVWL